MSKPRVVVGVSGGVDSTVAALLLLRQGYDVCGVFMKNWEDAYEPGYCGAAADLEDAREVCERLRIPLITADFSQRYRRRVFDRFLDELGRGRTPNPDILCNREVKFPCLRALARDLGAAAIATGHHARIGRAGAWLLRGMDQAKDQSYFLSALDDLRSVLFPIGGLTKAGVRRLAAKAGLETHDKPDSTGICFIGERHYRDFVGRYLPPHPGEIRTAGGRVVGSHGGLHLYTLGQRRGLGVGGVAGERDAPWYVIAKDLEGNALVVSQDPDHERARSSRLAASGAHWIGRPRPSAGMACSAQVRYRQAPQPCTIEGIGGDEVVVSFQAPQRAVTPGQSVVLYQGDRCLGGATIDATSG